MTLTIPVAFIVLGYALVYYAIAQITGKGDQLHGFLGLGSPTRTSGITGKSVAR